MTLNGYKRCQGNQAIRYFSLVLKIHPTCTRWRKENECLQPN